MFSVIFSSKLRFWFIYKVNHYESLLGFFATRILLTSASSYKERRQERNRISNSVKNESVKVRESFFKLVNSKLYIIYIDYMYTILHVLFHELIPTFAKIKKQWYIYHKDRYKAVNSTLNSYLLEKMLKSSLTVI